MPARDCLDQKLLEAFRMFLHSVCGIRFRRVKREQGNGVTKSLDYHLKIGCTELVEGPSGLQTSGEVRFSQKETVAESVRKKSYAEAVPEEQVTFSGCRLSKCL